MDYGQLTDAADQEWEQCQQSQEWEQWLRDENAQREFQLWLDTFTQPDPTRNLT